MNQNLFITGNYFKARITRIEPTLEAAFVDYGADRHGFLPLKDINGYDKSVHNEGFILTVCISKVEYGQKGAQVTASQEVPEGINVHELINENIQDSHMTSKFIFLFVVLVSIGIVFYTNI